MTLAREVLKVIHGGDELPGVTFYGLVPRGKWAHPAFPVDLWAFGGSYSPGAGEFSGIPGGGVTCGVFR
ncbi:hypothetical protein, partial [Micromonospora sp. LOL_023]|uniref:hypothetical protein n=1 Tax=Micromonospora sp. LOL_023 TaxID=3345418 RepID=UPI003A8991CE